MIPSTAPQKAFFITLWREESAEWRLELQDPQADCRHTFPTPNLLVASLLEKLSVRQTVPTKGVTS